MPEGFAVSALTAAAVAVGSVVAFRKERMDGMGGDAGPEGGLPADDSPRPAGGGPPPGTDLVALMTAVHGANEAARRRSAGGCGDGCGCHA